MKPLRGDREIQLRIMLHETIAWRLGISTRLQLDFAPRALKYNKHKWYKTISKIKILFSMWPHFLIKEYFVQCIIIFHLKGNKSHVLLNHLIFPIWLICKFSKSPEKKTVARRLLDRLKTFEDGCSIVGCSIVELI